MGWNAHSGSIGGQTDLWKNPKLHLRIGWMVAPKFDGKSTKIGYFKIIQPFLAIPILMSCFKL